MKELKILQLNNKSLEDFDKLMSYHLDKVEDLEINEINISSKLYNLISLCTNLKKITIKGDLRSDVNKIFFNISKPEKIETIILESVKLPTNKAFTKFSNFSTISLNNIKFSDVIGFLNRIPNPEKIIALNLTNVDLGKRSISICSKFENLKYLNIDGVKNCIFDNFDFLYENQKISRFEFYNNTINFENVNTFLKGRFKKKIKINIQTSKNSSISNSLKINEDSKLLIVNACDLEKAMGNISFYKLSKLCIILGNESNLGQYIKKFKKSKVEVSLVINDIRYFNSEDAQKFQDRLNLQFINILQNPKKLNESMQCYSVEDYIKIRQEFDKINAKISTHSNELDTFNELYNYFKNNIKYTKEDTDLKLVFLEKIASYDCYAIAINSCLKELGFESKVIKGTVYNEENHYWNQVKINDNWYNFDLAYELKAKENKQFLKYVFKSNLLNDEQFYKTHTPYFDSKPERCYIELQEVKKELKKEQGKVSFWKNLYLKILSIFRFNKDKALSAPNEEEK